MVPGQTGSTRGNKRKKNGSPRKKQTKTVLAITFDAPPRDTKVINIAAEREPQREKKKEEKKKEKREKRNTETRSVLPIDKPWQQFCTRHWCFIPSLNPLSRCSCRGISYLNTLVSSRAIISLSCFYVLYARLIMPSIRVVMGVALSSERGVSVRFVRSGPSTPNPFSPCPCFPDPCPVPTMQNTYIGTYPALSRNTQCWLCQSSGKEKKETKKGTGNSAFPDIIIKRTKLKMPKYSSMRPKKHRSTL